MRRFKASIAVGVGVLLACGGVAVATAVAGGLSTTPETTTDFPSPSAPTLVAAVAGDNGVTLTWNAPDSDGGSPIVNYEILRGTQSQSEGIQDVVGNVHTYTDTRAARGTTYYYAVSAMNQGGWWGPRSNELSVTATGPLEPPPPPPPSGPPSAPTLISAVAGADGVTLHWSPPASDGGSPIVDYEIRRGTESDLTTMGLVDIVGNVDTYLDKSTVRGTTYFYAIAAHNQDGWLGAPSNELSVTATGPPPPLFHPYQAISVGSWPEAVAIGDVTGDGRNDVVMTTSYYFDPANDFRLFVFAQQPDGSLSAPVSYPTAATYTNRSVSVAIGDITGDGRSDVVLAVHGVGLQLFPQLPDGTLGSPTTVASANSDEVRLGQLNHDGRLDAAAIGSGGNNVGVLLNDGHGGLSAPVVYPAPRNVNRDDLEVADLTGDGLDDLVFLSAGPGVSVVPQLPAGGFGPTTAYNAGTNAFSGAIGVGDLTGDGRNDVAAAYGGNRPDSHLTVFPQTASATLATPATYPSYDIPEAVDAADFDLDGIGDAVVLHGGWESAGVYIGQKTGVPLAEHLYGIPYASHYNPHGLAVGDINGDGSPDIALADSNNGLVVLRNTVAPTTAPHAPGLTSAVATDGSVSLTWNVPESTGGSPSGYRIYRGTSSGHETLLATIGAATSYTDDTAADGTTYYYELSGVNSLGEGARSVELAAKPTAPPAVPGAPTLTSATPGNGNVALTWTGPSSDGGDPISSFKIYRGTASGGESLLATVGNGTGYTDFTALNGTTYYYKVSAVNGVGTGDPSNELSATPFAPDTTAPTTPGSVKVLLAGTNQLALDWAPSSDNVGVTSYRVYRNGVAVTSVGTTQYLDGGLAAGTSYTYRVSAVDAAGNQSPLSSTVSGSTAATSKGSTGTLAGVVYDDSGELLANALVTLTRPGFSKSVKTNSSGVWKLSSLKPAAYSVTVSLTGYRSQTLSMSASAGSTLLAVTSLSP